MLATLGGILALLVGLAVMVLPLLVPELSRARDSVWGALVLLLGLALVTSAERLAGSPMLVVLCGGLLLGRLGSEVAQARWQQLSTEERQALGAAERWQRSLAQLGATARQLLSAVGALFSALPLRRSPRGSGKRWIRQELGAGSAAGNAEVAEAELQAELPAAPQTAPQAAPQTGSDEAKASDLPSAEGDDGSLRTPQPPDNSPDPSETLCNDSNSDTVTVTSFAAIDALIEAAPADGPAGEEPSSAGTGAG